MICLINLNLLKVKLGALNPRRLASAKQTSGSSLLGLALDGHRLEAALVKRSNGSVRVLKTLATTLELNLLTQDPELAGREIRNHLDRAGIRERDCAVCLPLDWALTLQVPVPELPEADIQSFLDIETERGFPFGPETLSIVSSRWRGADGGQFATLIAIPKENLSALQKVLKAARLRPVTFSLGLPALEDPAHSSSSGVAAVQVGENSLELQVTCNGGIAALRTLHAALEQDGVHKKPYADVVARDLRITLGQLPAHLSETIRQLKVFGHGDELDRFVDELASRAKLMGLEVQRIRSYDRDAFPVQIPDGTVVSPALSLAVRRLAGSPIALEFLPPKVRAWKQLTQRYSSGKLVWTGAAAGGVLAIVLAAFLLQQWQLGQWRAKWAKIKPRAAELENMQQEIRRFRPWFDDSFRSLTMLKKVTEAFPEDGAVSATRIEIRDPGVLTCSGTTRDQQSVLKVVDRLRAEKSIASAEVEHIRGKQFTINVRLSEGGGQ